MSCDIEPVLPEGPVYRMARGPDPWAWVDWVYAGPDSSFGGRFDDPDGEYRVLYAAATRLGALMETLAGFRTHPAVRQSLPDGDAAAPDSVPREWLELRRIGEARARRPVGAPVPPALDDERGLFFCPMPPSRATRS